MVLVALAVGMLPGLLWLWFFSTRDRYARESKTLVLQTYGLGILCAVPAALLNGLALGLMGGLTPGGGNAFSIAIACFLVIGPVEEGCKYLATRLFAYERPAFSTLMDGLTYSAAAALGFASIENVSYVLGGGLAVVVPRAISATLAHVLFASVWGYALGVDKFSQGDQRPQLRRRLVIAAALHGLYDFLLLTQTLLAFGVVPLMIVMWFWLRRKVRIAHAESPLRERPWLFLEECPSCGEFLTSRADTCPFCGARLPPRGETVYDSEPKIVLSPPGGRIDLKRCARCQTLFSTEDGVCPECGTMDVDV